MIVKDSLLGVVISYAIAAFLVFWYTLSVIAIIKGINTNIKMKHPPEGLDELETIKWQIACMEEEQNSFPENIFCAIENFFEKRRKRK